MQQSSKNSVRDSCNAPLVYYLPLIVGIKTNSFTFWNYNFSFPPQLQQCRVPYRGQSQVSFPGAQCAGEFFVKSQLSVCLRETCSWSRIYIIRDYLLRIKCGTTYIIFLGLFDDLFITVRWNIDRHFEKEKTLFGFSFKASEEHHHLCGTEQMMIGSLCLEKPFEKRRTHCRNTYYTQGTFRTLAR
jgi:hypothetical protein